MTVIDPSVMPKCVVQSLVAISLHQEDIMRAVALETVREIVILNPSVVADSGGINAILRGAQSNCHQKRILQFLTQRLSSWRLFMPSQIGQFLIWITSPMASYVMMKLKPG
jgi:hypothetical protein